MSEKMKARLDSTTVQQMINALTKKPKVEESATRTAEDKMLLACDIRACRELRNLPVAQPASCATCQLCNLPLHGVDWYSLVCDIAC